MKAIMVHKPSSVEVVTLGWKPLPASWEEVQEGLFRTPKGEFVYPLTEFGGSVALVFRPIKEAQDVRVNSAPI